MPKNRLAAMAATLAVLGLLTTCAPEVGSAEWCADMNQTPKGEWSANEAADYAKHCIF